MFGSTPAGTKWHSRRQAVWGHLCSPVKRTCSHPRRETWPSRHSGILSLARSRLRHPVRRRQSALFHGSEAALTFRSWVIERASGPQRDVRGCFWDRPALEQARIVESERRTGNKGRAASSPVRERPDLCGRSRFGLHVPLPNCEGGRVGDTPRGRRLPRGANPFSLLEQCSYWDQHCQIEWVREATFLGSIPPHCLIGSKLHIWTSQRTHS